MDQILPQDYVRVMLLKNYSNNSGRQFSVTFGTGERHGFVFVSQFQRLEDAASEVPMLFMEEMLKGAKRWHFSVNEEALIEELKEQYRGAMLNAV